MSLLHELNLFSSLKSAVLLFFAVSGLCFGQSTWKWGTLRPQCNDLYSVAYGNGQFVAVGEYSAILMSPDGATWTSKNSGSTYPLNAVAYGKSPSVGQAGQFVAVGAYGTILTSLMARPGRQKIPVQRPRSIP